MQPKVDFVENKAVPGSMFTEYLQLAIDANRHSNFGPVLDKLELELAELNGSGAAHAACCTANGTLALQATMASFNNYCGKKLRWAVSDFSFFTSFIGPMVEQQWFSCGDNGMFSLEALRSLDLDSYDGVLVTNIFGLGQDFDALFDFCRQHKKVLIVDNAAGFRAMAPYHENRPHTHPLLWAEVVSFHHTKPWGMGEGGAAFIPAELKRIFRAATNFGRAPGLRLHDLDHCTNSKMSEIAAAQILTRVMDYRNWVPEYQRQGQRILALGQAVGLKPLFDSIPELVAPGQIPFLVPQAIDKQELENPYFAVEKYYQPGAASGEVARWLYDHIINLPCHAGMRELTDEQISQTLSSFVKQPQVAAVATLG